MHTNDLGEAERRLMCFAQFGSDSAPVLSWENDKRHTFWLETTHTGLDNLEIQSATLWTRARTPVVSRQG
jgi:hypothetical protein